MGDLKVGSVVLLNADKRFKALRPFTVTKILNGYCEIIAFNNETPFTLKVPVECLSLAE